MTLTAPSAYGSFTLRATIELDGFFQFSAPPLFDINPMPDPFNVRVKSSSNRFDEAFGEKFETRCRRRTSFIHSVPEPMSDIGILNLFGLDENAVSGLGHFCMMLAQIGRSSPLPLLPGELCILAYVRAKSGHIRPATATWEPEGFALETYTLDNKETWPATTLLFSPIPPHR